MESEGENVMTIAIMILVYFLLCVVFLEMSHSLGICIMSLYKKWNLRKKCGNIQTERSDCEPPPYSTCV